MYRNDFLGYLKSQVGIVYTLFVYMYKYLFSFKLYQYIFRASSTTAPWAVVLHTGHRRRVMQTVLLRSLRGVPSDEQMQVDPTHRVGHGNHLSRQSLPRFWGLRHWPVHPRPLQRGTTKTSRFKECETRHRRPQAPRHDQLQSTKVMLMMTNTILIPSCLQTEKALAIHWLCFIVGCTRISEANESSYFLFLF